MKKIHIKIKLNSSDTKIINFGDERYLVYLKSGIVNVDGELIKLFSKYFTIPPTRMKIYSQDSDYKILEII